MVTLKCLCSGLILAPSMTQRDRLLQNQSPAQSQVRSRCHKGTSCGPSASRGPRLLHRPGVHPSGSGPVRQSPVFHMLKLGLLVPHLCSTIWRGSCLEYQPGSPSLVGLRHAVATGIPQILIFFFDRKKRSLLQPPWSLLPFPDPSLVCVIRQVKVGSLDLNLKPSNREPVNQLRLTEDVMRLGDPYILSHGQVQVRTSMKGFR